MVMLAPGTSRREALSGLLRCVRRQQLRSAGEPQATCTHLASDLGSGVPSGSSKGIDVQPGGTVGGIAGGASSQPPPVGWNPVPALVLVLVLVLPVFMAPEVVESPVAPLPEVPGAVVTAVEVDVGGSPDALPEPDPPVSATLGPHASTSTAENKPALLRFHPMWTGYPPAE